MILRIAMRSILRQKRRSLFTGLTLAGGFSLLAITISVTEGSYGNIIDVITRTESGHVQIHRDRYREERSVHLTIADPSAAEAILPGTPRLEGWTPRVYGDALAFHDPKSAGVSVVGVDPEGEARHFGLARRVSEGRYFAPEAREALVGEGIARALGLRPGGEIVLISQGGDGSIANDVFAVAGIIGGEGNEGDRMRVYLPVAAAREFLSLGRGVHEIAVLLEGQERAREAAAWLGERFHAAGLPIRAEPWQVVREDFYRAMELDKKGNYVTLLIIAIVVAVGVLNTVLMIILERTHEFGVLKALGTRGRVIFSMIVLETLALALMSAIAGALAATPAIGYLASRGIKLSTSFDFAGARYDRVLAEFSVESYLVPFVITILTALLTSVVPALSAARKTPLEALEAQ